MLCIEGAFCLNKKTAYKRCSACHHSCSRDHVLSGGELPQTCRLALEGCYLYVGIRHSAVLCDGSCYRFTILEKDLSSGDKI